MVWKPVHLVATVARSTREKRQIIKENLEWRLANLSWEKSWQHFPAFHLARYEAYQLLDNLRKTGQLNRMCC
jgi:hypothetical protein